MRLSRTEVLARARVRQAGAVLSAAFVVAIVAGGGPAAARGDPPDLRGVRVPEREGAARAVRWVHRALFYVPRVAIETALAPARFAAWSFDRYQVPRRVEDVFFTDDRTFGLYPTVDIESEYGVAGGARLVHRDLFGRREHASLRARYGGRHEQSYRLDVHSGDRLSGWRIELVLRLDVVAAGQFFGVGNLDLSPAGAARGADPLARDLAVHSRFRQETLAGSVRLPVRLAPGLTLAPEVGLSRVRFGRTDAMEAGEHVFAGDAYDPGLLPGFGGYLRLDTALSVEWDGRRRTRPWLPITAPSSGVRLAARVAFSQDPGRPRLAWPSYLLDLEALADLSAGWRVLAFRARGEVVSGALDSIAFSDLPSLGGPWRLRGYERDRFRDRASALVSAEYRWFIHPKVQAYGFADAGRVFSGLDRLSARGWRLGYGAGFRLFSDTGTLVVSQVASSIDGGVHVDVSLDPGGAAGSGGR